MSIESIKTFINHFETQISEVRKVENNLHRKVLFAIMLDPFSRACFGQSGTHRERVTNLIEKVSGWDTHDHLSLPQLKLKLEESGEDTGALISEVKNQLAGWPDGHVIRISQSPKLSSLEQLASNKLQMKILKSSRYASLFYTYRNTLVHEFREPGYGMEISDDGSEP